MVGQNFTTHAHTMPVVGEPGAGSSSHRHHHVICLVSRFLWRSKAVVSRDWWVVVSDKYMIGKMNQIVYCVVPACFVAGELVFVREKCDIAQSPRIAECVSEWNGLTRKKLMRVQISVMREKSSSHF